MMGLPKLGDSESFTFLGIKVSNNFSGKCDFIFSYDFMRQFISGIEHCQYDALDLEALV